MGRANSKQQLDQIQTATNVHPNDSFEDAVLRLAAQFRHSRMLLRESRRIPGLHPRLRPSGVTNWDTKRRFHVVGERSLTT